MVAMNKLQLLQHQKQVTIKLSDNKKPTVDFLQTLAICHLHILSMAKILSQAVF